MISGLTEHVIDANGIQIPPMISPEGSVTKDESLLPFKRGGFRLVHEMRVVACWGNQQAWPIKMYTVPDAEFGAY